MQKDNPQEYIQITVIVAGRPYTLNVKAIEENLVRSAVKQLNDKINELQLQHWNKDKQDCLALVALTQCIELAQRKPVETTTLLHRETNTDNTEITNQLTAINSMLDMILRKF